MLNTTTLPNYKELNSLPHNNLTDGMNLPAEHEVRHDPQSHKDPEQGQRIDPVLSLLHGHGLEELLRTPKVAIYLITV